MKRRDPLNPVGDQSENTRELTGWDATMGEAEVGDAGNGADPWGADLQGGPPRSIEEEPDVPADITPDLEERWPGQPADEDLEVTVRLRDREPVDPAEI